MFIQDTTATVTTSGSSVQNTLLVLVPLIAGVILPPIMNWLKAAMAWIDKLPPTTQRLIVALLAAGFNWGCQLLHVTAPTDISGVNAAWIGTVLTTLIALGVHLANELRTVQQATGAKGH